MQRSKRPFVFVNMAMTADGKIATANRRISTFSSPRDRDHMLELRARADAVMAGARTVDLNPVNLGPGPARFRQLRQASGLAEYNLRIIVSGTGSIDPKAEIFRRRFSPIIILTTGLASERRLKTLRRLADAVRICGETKIDFASVLPWLRSEWNVKRLLCEGGGELNGALFAEGLVDELHLTICPKIFGGRHAPTICDGQGVEKLAQATGLRLTSMEQVGNEMFLVYRVLHPLV